MSKTNMPAIVMPAVSSEEALIAFKSYQDLANKILTKDDIQIIQGKEFKKKSFWRKVERFFNLSLELKEERRLDNNGTFTYHFVFRAIAPNGAFMDGCGSCSSTEKGLLKTEHNTRATAETRAKNRAISDLCAFGEVSAEEITQDTQSEETMECIICGDEAIIRSGVKNGRKWKGAFCKSGDNTHTEWLHLKKKTVTHDSDGGKQLADEVAEAIG